MNPNKVATAENVLVPQRTFDVQLFIGSLTSTNDLHEIVSEYYVYRQC